MTEDKISVNQRNFEIRVGVDSFLPVKNTQMRTSSVSNQFSLTFHKNYLIVWFAL